MGERFPFVQLKFEAIYFHSSTQSPICPPLKTAATLYRNGVVQGFCIFFSSHYPLDISQCTASIDPYIWSWKRHLSLKCHQSVFFAPCSTASWSPCRGSRQKSQPVGTFRSAVGHSRHLQVFNQKNIKFERSGHQGLYSDVVERFFKECFSGRCLPTMCPSLLLSGVRCTKM